MPVVTRSMKKNTYNSVTAKPVSVPPVSVIDTDFFKNMREMACDCNSIQENNYEGKEKKMRSIIKIYKYVNSYVFHLIERGLKPKNFNKFACVSFYKAVEFENECKKNKYYKFDPSLVSQFLQTISKSIVFLVKYIKSIGLNDEVVNLYEYKKAMEIINKRENPIKKENIRPRRNVPRVNYAGMDESNVDDDLY
jgi:hypothetical protein